MFKSDFSKYFIMGKNSLKLVYARKIYASFKPLRVYKAMLIENGIVKELYKDDLIEGTRVDEIIDLRNYYIIPAFIDAHIHLDEVGEKVSYVDLSRARSISDIQEFLLKYSESKGGWIVGRGFDHENLKEKRMPTRHDIDKIINNRPVIIIRVDGHSAVLNSYALEILRIESSDGVIKENELFRVLERIREERMLKEEKEILVKAQEEFLKNGVTTVGFMSCDLKALRALSELKFEGKLKLRVMVYLTPSAFDKTNIKDYDEGGMLRVNGVKLFADGSFGSRTALLTLPYNDDPLNYGVEVMKKDDMLEYCRRVNENGLQCAIHAIGDKALDNVLDVFEKIKFPKNRIEHASLIREDQFDRLRTIRPIVVVQPHFLVSDFWIVERLGVERLKNVYPFRRILDSGLIMAFSTDAPVEPINPWETIEASINRGVISSYTKEEGLSLLDAMDCYTRHSALAVDRTDIGMLLEGYRADFVVLDNDIYSQERKIIRVYLDGEIVYPMGNSND